MGFISREIIQEIKDRIDVISLVSRYLNLQRVGSRFRAPCPFHQETKPSFYIDPDLGLYHCFGCHASGDIIDFYCKINGLDFYEGLKELAQEVGISLDNTKIPSSKRPSKKKLILEINDEALNFFKTTLKNSPQAYEYLKKRAIDENIITEFQLGYAKDSWNDLKSYLLKKGYSIDALIDSGVLIKGSTGKVYDRFRNRIIFPILDIRGRCIGFGGRAIGDEDPKYLNTSENEVFKKGENLYGLNVAKREIISQKFAILTEGYIDVIRLYQYGYRNSCGVLGTALTSDHVKKISNFCPKVVLIFDGDEAGYKAAFRSAQIFLQYGITVSVVELPEGEDVDSYLISYGKDALDKLIKNAKQGLVFCSHMIKLNNSPREVIRWCREFLASLHDPALKGFYLPVISKELGISEFELGKIQNETKALKRLQDNKTLIGIGEKEILKFAICYPEYIDELRKLNAQNHMKNRFAQNLFEKLVSHPEDEILYVLDEEEKRFYIESLFFRDQDINPNYLWKDIKEFLEKKEKERLIKEAKEGLIQAQMEKNQEKIDFFMKEINRLAKN